MKMSYTHTYENDMSEQNINIMSNHYTNRGYKCTSTRKSIKLEW